MRQLSREYDKQIERNWDNIYPETRMLKYKIYRYYLYDLHTKENLTFREQFKIIYASGVYIIDLIGSWLNWINTYPYWLYNLYKNIGIKDLYSRYKIGFIEKPTIEELLTKNTNDILEMRNGVENNYQKLRDLQIQNPQFNILIQQNITKLNEFKAEIDRTIRTNAGQSAVLTTQVLKRLKNSEEILDKNTREIASLIETISNAGSLANGSRTARVERSPLSTPPSSP
jgi:hypothetical protein